MIIKALTYVCLCVIVSVITVNCKNQKNGINGKSSGQVNEELPPEPGNSISDIYQKVIDLDLLEPYWHTDVFQDRKPLIVIVPDITYGKIKLQKFGMPVTVIERSDSVSVKNKAVFYISKVTCSVDRIDIEFSYPPEGLSGTVTFEKKDGIWVITDKTIVEH